MSRAATSWYFPEWGKVKIRLTCTIFSGGKTVVTCCCTQCTHKLNLFSKILRRGHHQVAHHLVAGLVMSNRAAMDTLIESWTEDCFVCKKCCAMDRNRRSKQGQCARLQRKHSIFWILKISQHRHRLSTEMIFSQSNSTVDATNTTTVCTQSSSTNSYLTRSAEKVFTSSHTT